MYKNKRKRSIAVRIRYDNRNQGAWIWRGRGRWRGRVHECLLLDGVSMVMSVEDCALVPGSGQTRSLTSSQRYSLILSKRYICRSESPVGAIGGGLSTQDGNHTPRSRTRCSSSAMAVFLRKTTPGWSRLKRK